jgi:predicted transposase/invertase (TIGR01784 family)
MKTDKLFYRIFLSQPELIAELLSGIPAGCEFEYSAPVVKEKEVRLDGLLTPKSDDLAVPLVFLEAQMQPDEGFYGRFFAGLFTYLNQYKVMRPWRGLLILQSHRQELGSVVPYQMELNGGWMHRLYLEDLLPLSNLGPTLALLRLLVVPDAVVAADAQAILAKADSQAEFLRVLDLVEAILVSKLPSLSIEEIKEMLDLQDVSLSETQFFKEVFQQGEDQGRQEGRQEGEANSALRQIGRRCGEISIEQQTQIRSLSIAQLENLGDALLDFGGMADLVEWLRVNVDV